MEGRKDERRQRIEGLRQDLREAELAEAVDRATPAAHNVAPTPGSSESTLGPSVIVPLGVNGVPTDALVDTGSPATIVSLKFILQVLADSKDSHETAEGWWKKTMERFSAPAVTLTSCGGERLNIVAQIPVILSQGERKVDAVVLVQKDAPHSLLLSTDLQARLGFSLFSETDGRRVDLLRADEDEPGHKDGVTAPSPSLEQSLPTPTSMAVNQGGQGPELEDPRAMDKKNSLSPVGVVRLLQNVKVPPGYKKMVRAKMEGEIQHGLLLCTPCTDRQVVMADSVLEVGEGCCVNLIVENHSVEPVQLRKGTILGEVAEVEEVVSNQTPAAQPSNAQGRTRGEVLVGTGYAIGAVHGVVSELCEDRGARLLRDLNLSMMHLTSTQHRQLRDMLQSHSDVFALDYRELGTTSIVTHVIDTGNHAPVRQPVRRTPFALRATVDKLVADMLDQGVIQPSSSPWASPIVLVRKKDGGTRFCVDYRKLNQITKLDVFPLPCIDDTLDLLAGTRYFTTLDLASGNG